MKILKIAKIQSFPLGMANSGSDGKARVSIIGADSRSWHSPQSIKRAMRDRFAAKLPAHDQAIRGRLLFHAPAKIAERYDATPDDIEIVTRVGCIAAFGGAKNLAFLPVDGVRAFIDILSEPGTFEMLLAVGHASKIKAEKKTQPNPEDIEGDTDDEKPKKLKVEAAYREQWNAFIDMMNEIQDSSNNTDIAFNGRMNTANTALKVISAVSIGAGIAVSGSIATNAFSAIDTLGDKPVTAHLGTKPVVQMTSYSEMTIDIAQAAYNLPMMETKDLTQRVVWCAEAFIDSYPHAGMTTSGYPGLPSTVMAYLADPTQGRIMGGWGEAFESRIIGANTPISVEANRILTRYITNTRDSWNTTGDIHMFTTTGNSVDGITNHQTINNLIDNIQETL